MRKKPKQIVSPEAVIKAARFASDDTLLSLSALTSDQQTDVLDTYGRLGTEQLQPVFDALNGKVCYDELYLLRLYHLVKAQGPEPDVSQKGTWNHGTSRQAGISHGPRRIMNPDFDFVTLFKTI